MKLETSNTLESVDLLNKLLDNVPSSVFLVDQQNKIIKSNKMFKKTFHVDDSTFELCGNVMGCQYAIEENVACGLSTHCDTCEINQSIIDVLIKKKNVNRVEFSRQYYKDNVPHKQWLAFTNKYITYQHQPLCLIIIDNLTKIERLKLDLEDKNFLLNNQKFLLQEMVNNQTEKIENLTISIVKALEKTNQFNDTDTGNHIKRVSEYSAILAKGLGCDHEFVEKIHLFASLHDIGKVGIADNILKKPGIFTDEEYTIMKNHVQIGVDLLKESELDQMAKNIVAYHHCKYDGSGYSTSVSGEDIPLEARIVTLADVFDALVTRRVYKPAFSDEKSFGIIRDGIGTHFDPKVVKIFFEKLEEINEIRKKYK